MNGQTEKRVERNVYWSLVGKVTNLLGALLVTIFVARYLGPINYGLMNYVVSFVSLFLILATFGFDNIEIREEAKSASDRDYIIGTTFFLRLGLSFITMGAIILTAYLNESDNNTFWLIAIYSLSVIITPFDVIRNHFTALVQNEYIVKAGIVRTIISCIIKVVLLLIHASLIWFVISLVFDALILMQGYIYVYRKKISSLSSWKFSKRWAKYLLHQSFPLMLSGAAATIFLQIDVVMIGNMLEDKDSVGYFSVASKFVEILIYLPTIAIQTVSPILVETKRDKPTKYIGKAQSFMNVTVWGTLLCSILLAICAYPVVILTLGKAYLPAVLPLQILAFKAVGAALNMASGQILIIDERQKFFVLRSLSGCLVCIVLNYIFIPLYGITGVAFISIATQFMAGFIIHAIIPSYRYVFRMQLSTLQTGWKDLSIIKDYYLKKKNHSHKDD